MYPSLLLTIMMQSMYACEFHCVDAIKILNHMSGQKGLGYSCYWIHVHFQRACAHTLNSKEPNSYGISWVFREMKIWSVERNIVCEWDEKHVCRRSPNYVQDLVHKHVHVYNYFGKFIGETWAETLWNTPILRKYCSIRAFWHTSHIAYVRIQFTIYVLL